VCRRSFSGFDAIWTVPAMGLFLNGLPFHLS
jgi:hypothetical protein